MITKRIIPCLDIKAGRVIKGTQFSDLRDAGDPVQLAQQYNADGADELVLLDVTATNEGRKTLCSVVQEVARQVFIPLTVGGGVSSVADAERLLRSGADKIAVNSAAVKNPGLISELALRFGSQCVVIAIDARRKGSDWFVYINAGQQGTGVSVKEWLNRSVELGAGEILLTSIDADGSRTGYDIQLLNSVSEVSVPVIASGGAGCVEHFVEVFTQTGTSGALAASVFHYNAIQIKQLKSVLAQRGVWVRNEVE